MRMPGHVNQADKLAAGKLELAKAELSGHASAPFDLQTVGIFAGQRLDKGRLSVVDVSCCSNDNGTLDKLKRGYQRKPARTASTNADAHRSRSVSRKKRANVKQHLVVAHACHNRRIGLLYHSAL